MNQITGAQSRAVFAAQGRARPRLVRAALAGGAALLASWLIALALGVFGDFGSLPGLPRSRSNGSEAANSPVRRAVATATGPSETRDLRERSAEASRMSIPAPASSDPSPTRAQNRTENTTSKTTTRAPVSPSTPTPTGSAANNGLHLGTIKAAPTRKPTTTGKPMESPGNGPGGSGAPGQQR